MDDIADSLSKMEVGVILPLLKVVRFLFSLLLYFNDNTSKYTPQISVPDGQPFDYIIVGAGAAGSVLAYRLSENSSTDVLLIDAGGPPPLTSDVPGLFPFIDQSVTDWNYYSVDDGYSSQAHRTKNVHIARGKMLGGSSSSSYMSVVRGCKGDYDSWVQQGNEGWNWQVALKYFKKSERLDDIDIIKNCPNFHSTNGPLTVRRALWKERTHKYFEAFKERGYKIVTDLNGYNEMGYTMAQFATDDIIRQSSAVAYLRPIKKRKNLHLFMNTLVTKIVFDKNKRATAVEAILPDKRKITFRANREIIVSAGAINSPKLLMLSGVGPEEHLKEMNIKPVLDSPNVGENLQDHVLIPVTLTGKNNISSIVDNLQFIANLDKFPNPVMTGRIALNKSQECPDYQSYVLPFPAGSILPTILCTDSFGLENEICAALAKAGLFRETLFAVVALLYPESRGSVKLKSKNPNVDPIIRTGYFSNKKDLERHAMYMQDYVSVINTTYFKSVHSEIVDYKVNACRHLTFGSHDYWKCYVLNLASSMWDYSGTCAMGPEGKGVVDERLRVRGLTGLRVVDSSIMSTIVGGNVNAAVVMIGEKASDMIKEDNGEI